ncbi:MAG: hypothetical protein M0R76_05310 [Proteobacteria bacterium]|nr:hypothetical protein [Pseudomonadota bacterium]
MYWILSALLAFAVSGILGFTPGLRQRLGTALHLLCHVAAAAFGLYGLYRFAFSPLPDLILFNLPLPLGELTFRLDAISAIFLAPVFLVAPLGALYGLGYNQQHTTLHRPRKFRFWYGLMCAGTVGVLTADNAILFLLLWEIMAVSGYFVVAAEDHTPEAKSAGFVYFTATRIGTLALIAAFALLYPLLDLFRFPAAGALPAHPPLVFFLFLLGFGLKAGFMPLHVWLPGAHSAAPSHGSAFLSGIIIKLGIYGIVRVTSFCAAPPLYWGWTLLGLGAISGILGVAFALAQHDIKRLLAYHSVENIGIIAMGLGLALLGRSTDNPALIALGLGGALLHVVNHGLFKSLLFFSAGAVIRTTGTRDIDAFGGLLKRLPWTAALFLVGAVAISALPPFNGFVSEWLIFIGALQTLQSSLSDTAAALMVLPVLGLIGGLALACFVKIFGITFLGTPRTPAAQDATEATWGMRAAMLPLALACLVIGVLPTLTLPTLQMAAHHWTGIISTYPTPLPTAIAGLGWVSRIALVLIAATLLLTLGLRFKARRAPKTDTWGCGYNQPTARMQYTASSFADGLIGWFRFSLQTKKSGAQLSELFPKPGQFYSHTPDGVLERLVLPLFQHIENTFVWLRRRVQNGIISFYLLSVTLTLVALLIYIF